MRRREARLAEVPRVPTAHSGEAGVPGEGPATPGDLGSPAAQC